MVEEYEEFSESQKRILERFVTDTSSNVFVLRNLPEVIKGALFSRYSRSTLGLRSLLLKEFILNEETAFDAIVGGQNQPEDEAAEAQSIAIKKAQNFYDRILDGYGDDSIGELGGAHLAIEQISMLAAKVIQDARVGGSPLEKSTRYVYFDQKVKGEYLFYREPVLMTSAYRDLYVETCNSLFETYSFLIPKVTQIMEELFPRDEEVLRSAYTAALRARVLDVLRGLLPAGTLTNMGVYGNGRFFQALIQKLTAHNLAELQEIGRKSYDELSKVMPSFVRRADPSHPNSRAMSRFYETMQAEIRLVASQHGPKVVHGLSQKEQPGAIPKGQSCESVRLIDYTKDAPIRVAAALLYSATGRELSDLMDYCRTLNAEELARILDSACSARENRRHKSPRALEQAFFTFELLSDFGVYRDLQRHRMLTQERQLLSCDFGYFVPQEIRETEWLDPYCNAMGRAREAFDTIREELPEEAQYVVPMAYRVRWYFHINLRALQWLVELRSCSQGHPTYRYLAHEMAHLICQQFPEFERFFRFADYEGYDLGRLSQEERAARKSQELS